MSTLGDPDTAAAIIFAYEQNAIGSWMAGARMTLSILDYILNMDREVRMIWTRPRSTAALLYFAIRCTSVVSATLAVSTPSGAATSPEMCNVITLIVYAVTGFELLPRAVFAAMRTYGLLKNSATAAIVFFLALIPFGVNMSSYSTGIHGVIFPMPFGCLQTTTEVPRALSIALNFTACACTMGSDILLIVITWLVIPRRGIIPDHSQIQRKGLMDVVYRDGIMYFIVQFLMDAFSIVVNTMPMFNAPFARSEFYVIASNMTGFIFPVSSILVAHFLLDLQEASSRTLRLNSDGPLDSEASIDQQSSLDFATRIVGSLGAVIDYRASNEEDSVDEDE